MIDGSSGRIFASWKNIPVQISASPNHGLSSTQAQPFLIQVHRDYLDPRTGMQRSIERGLSWVLTGDQKLFFRARFASGRQVALQLIICEPMQLAQMTHFLEGFGFLVLCHTLYFSFKFGLLLHQFV